VSRSDE